MRVDKWLWQARFLKTRGLATDLVTAGHVRLNGQRIAKPAQGVGAGDTLTFPQGGRVRLIRVLDLPERRGPATEAQAMYLDLDAPPDTAPPDTAPSALE